MDEYISREAVFQVVHGIARGIADRDIEALKAKDMKTLYKIAGAKEILDSVDTNLCYIPAADVQPIDRWIKADESLPVYGGMVLICDKSKNIRLGIYTDMGWCSQFGNPMMCKITHWQPLPEPPNIF